MKKSFIIIIVVRFLVLVTTMVTKVDHGNHRSDDRGNHCGYYDGYYNGNTWLLHLLPNYAISDDYWVWNESNIIENLKKSSKKIYSWRKNVLSS